jgi:hypothetical protein
MKPLRLLLCVPLLAACATLGGRRADEGAGARTALWRQAFDAYSRDSVRVARGLFQRLAAEHPRTREGHDARYYMALLSLDPRGGADPRAAEESLRIYLADDSTHEMGGGYQREARTLLSLTRELRNPCGSRATGLGCDTTIISRTVTTPGESTPGPNAAEVARLRRMYSERGDTIRDLRAELERIRNTLAPRRP